MKRVENYHHARFLTCSCYRNMPLLGNPRIRDVFGERLAAARDRLGFRLHAWVAMPDHVHLILRPGSPDQTIAGIAQAVKQSVARRILARWREIDAPVLSKLKGSDDSMHFWQRGGGYDRNVFSDEEVREKVEYIHANPVRAGLVERPSDWVWSSARWWAGERGEGVVAMDRLE